MAGPSEQERVHDGHGGFGVVDRDGEGALRAAAVDPDRLTARGDETRRATDCKSRSSPAVEITQRIDVDHAGTGNLRERDGRVREQSGSADPHATGVDRDARRHGDTHGDEHQQQESHHRHGLPGEVDQQPADHRDEGHGDP